MSVILYANSLTNGQGYPSHFGPFQVLTLDDAELLHNIAAHVSARSFYYPGDVGEALADLGIDSVIHGHSGTTYINGVEQ